MNTVKEILKKNEYRNWVKGTLGLERTNRALFEYVKVKFALFTHKRDGSHNFTEDVYNHIHPGTSCIRRNLERKIKYDRNNKTWEWKHLCEKCKEAFQTILSMHTNPSEKFVYPHNCADTTNITLEWAIARFFMPEGNASNTGPDNTDPATMIRLMLNCRLFTNPIREGWLKGVKKARNELLHSPDNLVDDNVLVDYFNDMTKLLTDASNDSEVDENTRYAIKEDIKTIENLKKAEITITLFEDALKIKRKAIYEDFEQCLTNNDIEQLKLLFKLTENVAEDLQFMNLEMYKNKIEQLQKREEKLKIELQRFYSTRLYAEGVIIIGIVTIGLALLLRL